MLEVVPMHTERCSWEFYIAQVLQDILLYAPSSGAALRQSAELHQPCERREKTLLAAVPQEGLLPATAAPQVPRGASGASIPVGATARAYMQQSS